jgi:hypothetical protein
MKSKRPDHGMWSRGLMEITTFGSSSWMPYAPQGVKGTDNDDDQLVAVL